MTEQFPDNHGYSLAAWVTVAILVVASAIMAFAVAFPNKPLFVGGAILAVIGGAVGKALSMAGYGVKGHAGNTQGSSGLH